MRRAAETEGVGTGREGQEELFIIHSIKLTPREEGRAREGRARERLRCFLAHPRGDISSRGGYKSSPLPCRRQCPASLLLVPSSIAQLVSEDSHSPRYLPAISPLPLRSLALLKRKRCG